MRNIPFSLVLLGAAAFMPVLAESQSGTKKRIAVFDFDSAAVQGGMASPFFQTTAPNTGKAVADLVVTQLVKAGQVSVIERAALDKLLAEQNLSNSDRTDALTAARIGRVLGVDGIVLGTITKWDYDNKVTGGGGGPLGGFIGRTSMTMKHDIKARVEVSARLVSPETAEVLAVAQGVGEVIRKGVKVDMRDTGQMGIMGMGGSSNNPTMSEAMDHAVVQLAAELGKNFASLPRYIPVIEGLVADSDESGRLVLNVGGRNGVKQGDRLQVWRAGKEIRDPATGKVLIRDDVLLGDAIVKTTTDNASIAAYSGAEKVKTGDLVKSPPHATGGPQ